MNETAPFLKFLENGLTRGGFETDDALGAVLPLMKQVLKTHAEGRVAPFKGVQHLLRNDQSQLSFDPAKAQAPMRNSSRVDQLQAPISRSLEVMGHSGRTADLDTAS